MEHQIHLSYTENPETQESTCETSKPPVVIGTLNPLIFAGRPNYQKHHVQVRLNPLSLT